MTVHQRNEFISRLMDLTDKDTTKDGRLHAASEIANLLGLAIQPSPGFRLEDAFTPADFARGALDLSGTTPVVQERQLHVVTEPPEPVPIRLVMSCVQCGKQHLDEGEWATRPHKTHRCVSDAHGVGCGLQWKPSVYPTVGVRTEQDTVLLDNETYSSPVRETLQAKPDETTLAAAQRLARDHDVLQQKLGDVSSELAACEAVVRDRYAGPLHVRLKAAYEAFEVARSDAQSVEQHRDALAAYVKLVGSPERLYYAPVISLPGCPHKQGQGCELCDAYLATIQTPEGS